MKRYGGIPLWIIFTVAGLSLGFSIWALVMAYSRLKAEYNLSFDASTATEVISLVITVIGVVLTVYFVIIGINATRIEKEIESTKKQIEKELKIVECNNLDKIYGQSINIAKTIVNEKERTRIIKALRLENARLASQSRFLNDITREQRLPDLAELGDEQDIEDLNRIINDPTENDSIRQQAEEIKKALKETLKKASEKYAKEEVLRGLNSLG